MKSGSGEQSISHLLAPEEADLVISLLGNKCQALAMSVIQLFLTDPPQHSTWRKHESGILCLVKDNLRRSYFLRLYCIFRRQMVWEHEVYNYLEYLSPKAFLHTFEGEDSIIAFNFASEEEARQLRNVLLEKLEAMKKRLEKRNRQSVQSFHQHSHTSVSSQVSNVDTHLSNGMVPVAKQKPHTAASGGRRKEKDSKRRLTKADIGMPQDFRHVSHVGWDPQKGFDIDNVEDPQLKQFFVKAGVSESQLQDRETREFIYDFINRHGGIDAVKSELVLPSTPQIQHNTAPPPVPARTAPSSGSSYQVRLAPPPPPSRSGPLPPPPLPSQPPAMGSQHPPLPPMLPSSTTATASKPMQPIPPPPVSSAPSVGAPPPPPPPPPPPNFSVPDPPAPSPAAAAAAAAAAAPPPPPTLGPPAGAPDPRSALMESIRSGKQLKHIEVESKRPSGGVSRGDLLDQIRQGVELKSVQPLPRPSQTSTPQNGLAGALARALAERSRVIHSDSSGSSGEDNEDEDEWED